MDIRPGELILLSDDSIIIYDINRECGHCSLILSNTYYDIMWSVVENHVIGADTSSKEMTIHEDNQLVDISPRNGIIDLDVCGRRWEGMIYNGEPCGFGVLYHENGRKDYEGFVWNGSPICYGKRYYADIEKVRFEGGFCFGGLVCKGVEYDRIGVVECNGLWRNDTPFSLESSDGIVHSRTEDLEIPNGSFNDIESFFLFRYLSSLKRIVLRDHCFGKVRTFRIEGLDKLESIVIGQNSVASAETADSQRMDSVCRIVDCPKLVNIVIGDWSFSDYHSLELNSLSSLQSIQVGTNCFHLAPVFSLAHLPQLQSMRFGEYAFATCHSVFVENLPKLQSIQLDSHAFDGDSSNSQKKMNQYQNVLTMRDLPSLISFVAGGYNFRNMGTVVLENISQLSFNGTRFIVDLLGDCFLYTHSLQSTSNCCCHSSSFDASTLESFIRSKSKYLREASHPSDVDSPNPTILSNQDDVDRSNGEKDGDRVVENNADNRLEMVREDEIDLDQAGKQQSIEGNPNRSTPLSEEFVSHSCCSILSFLCFLNGL